MPRGVEGSVRSDRRNTRTEKNLGILMLQPNTEKK